MSRRARWRSVRYRETMRTCLLVLVLGTVTSPAHADEPPPVDESGEDSSEDPSTRLAADAPKIALVVVGDPDEALQESAAELERVVMSDGSFRLPADSSLSSALRGLPAQTEDGLGHVRRERRGLGLGESNDVPILARLGRMAGAVLVVAIRHGTQGPEAVAFDVNRGQFFEGSLTFPVVREQAFAFISARARAALRNDTVSPAPDSLTEPSASPVSPAPAGAITAVDPAAEREPDWFEQNWPYFAAGALLIGATIFVVVAATDGGDPPPMLRFQPGAL